MPSGIPLRMTRDVSYCVSFLLSTSDYVLICKADTRLEVALRLVVGVHPENVGVMVRVLESHDVHLAAERNLRNIIYLY